MEEIPRNRARARARRDSDSFAPAQLAMPIAVSERSRPRRSGAVHVGAALVAIAAGCGTGSSSSAGVQPTPGFVGDRVWRDADGDGLQDPGEGGIEGVRVVVTDVQGVQRTAHTDALGRYSVTGLTPGTYSIAVDPASPPIQGWSPSPCGVGPDPRADSDCSPASVALALPVLGVRSIDFGFVPPPGSIGDFVWKDANGNGLQDPGEPGLAGVALTLTDGLGNPLASTLTDPLGAYAFVDLAPGDYAVAVSATPPGLVPAPCNVGNDDALDNDCSPARVAVGASADATVDFGFAGTGSIGDRVWADLDCNGLQDSGEPGLDGVRVVLTDAAGVERETLTVDGAYLFPGLCAGTYTVTVDEGSLQRFERSPCDVGPDDALDSECSPATVVLAADGTRDSTIDFGYCPPGGGSLGDLVWLDLDGDGVQDDGEPGIPDVPVFLLDPTGAELERTRTDGGGRYEFRFLAAGTYELELVVAKGALASPCDQGGDDARDNDCTPVVVALGRDERNSTVDFGFAEYPSGRIASVVWNDVDGDGLRDPDERGVAGARVELRGEGGALLHAGLTDRAGETDFGGLAPGRYAVLVDAAAGGLALLPSVPHGDRGLVVLTQDVRDVTIAFGQRVPLPHEARGPAAWRDHPAAWPLAHPPTTPFGDVFADAFPGHTLLDVLSLPGDGLEALGREAVAALLSAAAGGVSLPLPEREVIERFDAAWRAGPGEREAARRALAQACARGACATRAR